MSQHKLINGRFLSVTLPTLMLFLLAIFFFISNQNGYWTNVLYNSGTLTAPPFKQTLRKQGKSANRPVPFMIRQREIQEKRHAHLKQACEKYYNLPKYDVIKHPPWNMFLDTTHRVLYCNVPKVACTSWKRVLLVLSGVMEHTYDMEQKSVNRYGKSQLTTLSMIPMKDRKEVLDTYTKFMFVRHPFSRVLSAYNNKINPDSYGDHTTGWSARRRKIASMKGDGDGATFNKFLNYILPMTPAKDDRHWASTTNLCLPCDIQYDVIGKFETLSDDADYILKLVNADDLVKFPSANGSSPTNSSKKDVLQVQYEGISLDIIHQLYKKYSLDFQLFNYSIPKLTFL